jgi:hypothetical protein
MGGGEGFWLVKACEAGTTTPQAPHTRGGGEQQRSWDGLPSPPRQQTQRTQLHPSPCQALGVQRARGGGVVRVLPHQSCRPLTLALLPPQSGGGESESRQQALPPHLSCSSSIRLFCVERFRCASDRVVQCRQLCGRRVQSGVSAKGERVQERKSNAAADTWGPGRPRWGEKVDQRVPRWQLQAPVG